MNLSKESRRRKGHAASVFLFTVPVLMLVAVGGVTMPGGSAPERQARLDLKVIAQAFTDYRDDLGSWPRHACQSPNSFSSAYLAGYSCLFDNVYDAKGWKGPYLSHYFPNDAVFADDRGGPHVDSIDPWGECYMVYRFRGGQSISIVCKGSDRFVDTDLTKIQEGIPAGDDLIITMKK